MPKTSLKSVIPVPERHFVLALLEVVPAVHRGLPLHRRGLGRRGGGHHEGRSSSGATHGAAAAFGMTSLDFGGFHDYFTFLGADSIS